MVSALLRERSPVIFGRGTGPGCTGMTCGWKQKGRGKSRPQCFTNTFVLKAQTMTRSTDTVSQTTLFD